MDNIMQKTRELGAALLGSPEYTRMREAEFKVMTDAETAAAFGDWLAVKAQIGLLLENDAPNEDAFNGSAKALKDLDDRVSSMEPLREWKNARSAFEELVTLVNGELKLMLSGETGVNAIHINAFSDNSIVQ